MLSVQCTQLAMTVACLQDQCEAMHTTIQRTLHARDMDGMSIQSMSCTHHLHHLACDCSMLRPVHACRRWEAMHMSGARVEERLQSIFDAHQDAQLLLEAGQVGLRRVIRGWLRGTVGGDAPTACARAHSISIPHNSCCRVLCCSLSTTKVGPLHVSLPHARTHARTHRAAWATQASCTCCMHACVMRTSISPS